ncbi:transporter [Herminiimonas sp. KBW02]|uniref:nicotinamide riboside transporter PnuC n=1 Tax=Herminiimonas sp. KBW02 TaxID=2153363 RepID=UPI000F5AA157|nr:nicotinamide riboside transporter PnuC [Herminiimonas sp. KBW02]RQO37264.1 transporter [Herminiimonas sp. KBW02]
MNATLTLFGIVDTSILELASFALALIMVLLNIRQSPWAWLFSIVSAAMYAVVFYDSKIYGDMSLQFFFIAVSLWGWYQWLFGGATHHGIQVSRLTLRSWLYSAAAWLVGFVAIAAFLRMFTDTDVPHMDAFLTAGSLVGQILLSRKKLENWYAWIVIDLIYIVLYLHKNLYLTALLFAIFAVLAVVGLRAWEKSLREQELP